MIEVTVGYTISNLLRTKEDDMTNEINNLANQGVRVAVGIFVLFPLAVCLGVFLIAVGIMVHPLALLVAMIINALMVYGLVKFTMKNETNK
jgi:Flp pilus assembly protein TadB